MRRNFKIIAKSFTCVVTNKLIRLIFCTFTSFISPIYGLFNEGCVFFSGGDDSNLTSQNIS